MRLKYFRKRSLMTANEAAKQAGRNYLDEDFIAGLSSKKHNGIPLETGWMRINVGVGDDEQFHSVWFDVRLETLKELTGLEVTQ